MRIGNVAQSSPSHSFGHGIQAIPQFTQNNLLPFSFPQMSSPSSGSIYQFPQTSSYVSYQSNPQVTSPQPSFSPLVAKPSYSLYNYAQHFPDSSSFHSPAFSSSQPPSPFPVQRSPVRSHYNPRGASPYAFERFGEVDKSNNYYPFQQLNAGETLPQSSALVNFNFGRAGEVYRPNRFARNPSQNATSFH